MTEPEIEETLIELILASGIIGKDKEPAFLQGEIYKFGTRCSIKNEDVIVEVLSIDDKQFQNATVSVRTYVDDMNIGSPKLVPNTERLKQITLKFEEVFKSTSGSYALTTGEFRMRLNSAKRERREDLNQHCVNCIFDLVIINV